MCIFQPTTFLWRWATIGRQPLFPLFCGLCLWWTWNKIIIWKGDSYKKSQVSKEPTQRKLRWPKYRINIRKNCSVLHAVRSPLMLYVYYHTYHKSLHGYVKNLLYVSKKGFLFIAIYRLLGLIWSVLICSDLCQISFSSLTSLMTPQLTPRPILKVP